MNMKILIVEDNLILSGMLGKWLQKAGYEVLKAIDEPSARSILKKNEISLVLGDVRLPEGNGLSLLEWMVRSGMEIPFIVMTDYACYADAPAQSFAVGIGLDELAPAMPLNQMLTALERAVKEKLPGNEV